MQEQINKLQQQIDDLKQVIASFSSDTSIPFEIGNAFKVRILPPGFASGETLVGTPPTVVVNEAGSSLVTVCAPFTGKAQIIFNDGNTITVPTF